MEFRTVAIGVLSTAGLAAFFYYGAHAPQIPVAYVPHESLTQLPEKSQGEISGFLEKTFGTPDAPRLPEECGVEPRVLQAGREFYRRQCLHCHGVTGDGAGTTAPFMTPPPRDYRKGVFKISSTMPNVDKPSRQDLVDTLKRGLPGTLMPAFSPLFDDQTLGAVVDYVILLSMRGETEMLLIQAHKEAIDDEEELGENLGQEILDQVIGRWKETEGSLVTPSVPRPSATEESIAKGREIFLSSKTNCFGCHGMEGRGGETGQSVQGSEFKDDWGNRIFPADLTQGIYRGGARPLDLWRRIYKGVKGTQMPGFAETLTEEEIWHVVNFLKSLVAEEEGKGG